GVGRLVAGEVQHAHVAAHGVGPEVGPAALEHAVLAGELAAHAADRRVVELQLPAHGGDRVRRRGAGLEARGDVAAHGVDLHGVGDLEQVEEHVAAHAVAREGEDGARGGDVTAHG